MFDSVTTDGIFVMLSLLETVVIAIAFAVYSYISHVIVKAHKGDQLYKKEKTVKMFNNVFKLLTLLFISIAVNFYFDAFWLICCVLTVLSVFSVITAWQFYDQIAIFKERRVNDIEVQKVRKKAQEDVRRKFTKQIKALKPETFAEIKALIDVK